ncbi:hypothetical protein F4802DRAFT_587205 [Xylaria palmicola]|nr:hypothetical protein F4802DRAFT_587205 [Xylaria palmicola]
MKVSRLQDAYSTLAAYMGKTEKNEEVVMQLVEDKAGTLLSQGDPSPIYPSPDSWSALHSAPTNNVAEHLSRVQALFIYQFIRLFDGDIRHRAQAEGLDATLQDWKTQMWEAAKFQALLRDALGEERFSMAHHDRAYEPVPQTWRDWILAESVRRTWIIVSYSQSVYITMRDGQGGCPGSISYTLRRGPWDSSTSAEWYQLITNEDPLFMRSDPPNMLFARASPREVSEFGLSIVSIMWDSRKIESWFAKSPDTHLQVLLQNDP